MTPLRVGIVVGSIRPGRRALPVAQWVREQAAARGDMEVELIDLAEQALPLLDEKLPAAYGRYAQPHTRAWAARIAPFDAFLFVTPEYNRSIPAALKNALDYLYAEWHDKAAGFVSYGIDAGGARAVEHLRGVVGELRMADVRAQVTLSLFEEFGEGEAFTPHERREGELERVLDQLVAWGGALRDVRAAAAA